MSSREAQEAEHLDVPELPDRRHPRLERINSWEIGIESELKTRLEIRLELKSEIKSELNLQNVGNLLTNFMDIGVGEKLELIS